MATNAANWKDCTMYVQDIDSPGTNITAGISKEEANNFKKMCQCFFADSSQKRLISESIDEYVSKVATLQQPVNKVNAGMNGQTLFANKVDDSPLVSMQSLKTAIKSVADNLAIGGNANPSSSKNLEKLIKLTDVSRLAKAEMVNLLYRSENRIRHEMQILETLSKYFITLDATLKVVNFGSVKYVGLNSNFNVLVKAGGSNSN